MAKISYDEIGKKFDEMSDSQLIQIGNEIYDWKNSMGGCLKDGELKKFCEEYGANPRDMEEIFAKNELLKRYRKIALLIFESYPGLMLARVKED